MSITSPAAAPKGVAARGQQRRTRPSESGPFNTLAQPGSQGQEGHLSLTARTKAGDTKPLLKRARVKYLTQALSWRLASIPDSPLTKSYWNTWHCSSVLQKQGDRLVAKFCKNRWCLTCCRIRTAQLIKQYLPTIQGWPEKHFVTLTVPNCKAEDLQATIKEMKRVCNSIRETLKTQHRRKQRVTPLVAIRKLEVTFNPTRQDYHPHFHFVVSNRQTADDLRKMWLTHFQEARWQGQDVRQADDRSTMELFKYFTKLVSSHSKERLILADPLDVIFQAIAGERTFQAFNVKVTKETSDEEAEAMAEAMTTDAVYQWEQSVTDWVDIETGELLTGYQPDDAFRELVEQRIITTSPPAPPNGS